jgi:hypothetical protein
MIGNEPVRSDRGSINVFLRRNICYEKFKMFRGVEDCLCNPDIIPFFAASWSGANGARGSATCHANTIRNSNLAGR